jgi:hypothetical protein
MPVIPNLFISTHAVEQFQKRIAPMSAARARQMILAGVSQATDVRVLPDGATLRVRTRRPFPFEFRAYCTFDEERGHPVVTTIVRGDSNVTRKHKRQAARNAEEEAKMARLSRDVPPADAVGCGEKQESKPQ